MLQRIARKKFILYFADKILSRGPRMIPPRLYLDWFLGLEGELIPPAHLIRAAGIGGIVDFEAFGREYFRRITTLAELKPDESILEVGCGIGRNALPLTTYLGPKGRFEAFDIVPVGIEWCQKNITPRYPNFHFQLANVYNSTYNPSGKFHASEFRFPYSDQSFDFVFLISVFTHMISRDLEHYLSEIARVLKNQGRCLITFFLLNAESLALIERGSARPSLKYESGPCRFEDKAHPENAIAYQEEYVRDLYRGSGLRIVEPIWFGSWSGRQEFLGSQDIIVARKAPTTTFGDNRL